MEERRPYAAVGTLLVNPAGQILLIKFSESEEYYHIPGGHVELGETIEQTCKREVKEETDLDVDSVDVWFVQEAIFPKEFFNRTEKHYIFIECICKVNSSEIKPSNEIKEYLWVAPKVALKMRIDKYTRKFVERYLKEKI